MKIPNSEHVVYINCFEYQTKQKKNDLCTQHVLETDNENLRQAEMFK